MKIPFIKMHGIGNDVIVIDGRDSDISLTPEMARRMGHRNFGIGCDQIMLITNPPANATEAEIGLTIYNNDGSRAGACGNGTRCVAALVLGESGKDRLTIAINDDTTMLQAWRDTDGIIAVDMGAPRLGRREIPLAREADPQNLDLGEPTLPPAVMVNMGNPHAVHFVDDAEAVDVPRLGARLERHAMFPHGSNVEFATILADNRIRMRVWERGAGETIACGSGACATLVAAVLRGLAEREAEIILDGGTLAIAWRKADDHVIMRGEARVVFTGQMEI